MDYCSKAVKISNINACLLDNKPYIKNIIYHCYDICLVNLIKIKPSYNNYNDKLTVFFDLVRLVSNNGKNLFVCLSRSDNDCIYIYYDVINFKIKINKFFEYIINDIDKSVHLEIYHYNDKNDIIYEIVCTHYYDLLCKDDIKVIYYLQDFTDSVTLVDDLSPLDKNNIFNYFYIDKSDISSNAHYIILNNALNVNIINLKNQITYAYNNLVDIRNYLPAEHKINNKLVKLINQYENNNCSVDVFNTISIMLALNPLLKTKVNSNYNNNNIIKKNKKIISSNTKFIKEISYDKANENIALLIEKRDVITVNKNHL